MTWEYDQLSQRKRQRDSLDAIAILALFVTCAVLVALVRELANLWWPLW
jgi:hypothetical protein